jgi:MinD-like ATPase involved in chromosome partitioning or flagellar assembly
MLIVAISEYNDSRYQLGGQLKAALQAAGLEAATLELAPKELDRANWLMVGAVLIRHHDESVVIKAVEDVRSINENALIVVSALPEQIVRLELLDGALLKKNRVGMISTRDVSGLVGFLQNAGAHTAVQAGQRPTIISFAHFKGGVGATSLALACASYWSRSGQRVCLVDFDPVSTAVSVWADVPALYRAAVGAALRIGAVRRNRLDDILYPVKGGLGALWTIGQPESFIESFQYNAAVLADAPDVTQFVDSLLEHLTGMCDLIVVDLGSSWGLAAFGMINQSNHIALVTDSTSSGIAVTKKSFDRVRSQVGKRDNFSADKWCLVMNRCQGELAAFEDFKNYAQIAGGSATFRFASLVEGDMADLGFKAPYTLYDSPELTLREDVEQLALILLNSGEVSSGGSAGSEPSTFADLLGKSEWR